MQAPNPPLYLLTSALADNQLILNLDLFDRKTGTRIVRSFSAHYTDDTLPPDVRKNFKDVANVHCIVNESPECCKVQREDGKVLLVYEVGLPNGNKLVLEGWLELEEKEVPMQEEIEEQNDKGMEPIEKKIGKLEEDVRKMQEFLHNDSKPRQEQLTKISKQIIEDVRQLKQQYEDIKIWKKQQELKFRQLFQQQIQVNKEKNSGNKSAGISDEMRHVFDQRFDELRQHFGDKFQKHAEKFEDLKQHSARHQKIIDKLTQQNIQLKKTLKALQDTSVTQLKKHESAEARLTDLQSLKRNQNIQNNKKNSQQQQKPKPKPNFGFEQAPKMHVNPEDILGAFFGGHQPQQTFTTSFTSPKASQNQSFTFTNEPMEIHPNSGYSKQFVQNGKVIVYNGITEEPTQLVGKLSIQKQRVSYLTILKTKNNQIGLGVMDSNYLHQRNSIKNKNFIILTLSNGGLYDSGSLINFNENTYKMGDKIKMRVNPVQGFIEWSVGGVVFCKHRNERLKDQTMTWVPVIRMGERGDTVRWSID